MRLLEPLELSRRFNEIELFRSVGDDNFLKVKYSQDILEELGQLFKVYTPSKKSMIMKPQSCYGNAIKKRGYGFEYVEGVITSKESGFKISHAWNVDSSGKHIDFTNPDPEKFVYIGVIIPWILLAEVGLATNRSWYSALPYLAIG